MSTKPRDHCLIGFWLVSLLTAQELRRFVRVVLKGSLGPTSHSGASPSCADRDNPEVKLGICSILCLVASLAVQYLNSQLSALAMVVSGRDVPWLISVQNAA